MKMKSGPKPIDGISRPGVVTFRASKSDLKALEQLRVKLGAKNRSRVVLEAVRAYLDKHDIEEHRTQLKALEDARTKARLIASKASREG